jgi:metallo-beta-lactamase class B
MMLRFLALALTLAAPALAQTSPQRVQWVQPLAPFRILGNVHHVGSQGLSAYLVTGPQGHVLIDGGLPESAPQIAASIRALGFRLADVKYILINHSHYDHAGGLAELKRLTGARLVATAGERPDLEAGKTLGRPELEGFPAVTVDRIVKDGEQVRLGHVTLTAIASPGHTRGGISWLTSAGGKTVLFATSLTVAGQKLVGDRDYPQSAADFTRTFARLRRVRADVFLNFHPEFFDLAGKHRALLAGNAEAFVDASETRRQIDRAEADFKAELVRQLAAR